MKSMVAIVTALGTSAAAAQAGVPPYDASLASGARDTEALESNVLVDKSRLLDIAPLHAQPTALDTVWNERIFSWTGIAPLLHLAANDTAHVAEPAAIQSGPRDVTPCADTFGGWASNQDDAFVSRVTVTLRSRGPGSSTTLVTDARGQIALNNLAPGDYEVEIDGKSLGAAVDALVMPSKQKSGASNVAIGGFFGGSSRSSSGHEGERGHSHSGNGGGMGVGLSVPLGQHGDPPPPPENPITAINITLPANPDQKVSGNTANWGTGTSVSLETPYCHETAEHGLTIGFKVPAGGSKGGFITISLEPANSTLNEISLEPANSTLNELAVPRTDAGAPKPNDVRIKGTNTGARQPDAIVGGGNASYQDAHAHRSATDTNQPDVPAQPVSGNPQQAHFEEVAHKLEPTSDFQAALKAGDHKRLESMLKSAGAGTVEIRAMTVKDGKVTVTYHATWIELAVVIFIIAG